MIHWQINKNFNSKTSLDTIISWELKREIKTNTKKVYQSTGLQNNLSSTHSNQGIY